MAPDSLLWGPPDRTDYRSFAAITFTSDDPLSAMFSTLLGRLQLSVAFDGSSRDGTSQELRVAYDKADFGGRRILRELSMRIVLHNQQAIHDWFDEDTPGDEDWERLLGMRLLRFDHELRKAPVTRMESVPSRDGGVPVFEVNSARLARRFGPNGEELYQLIIQLMQRRRSYFNPKEQAAADEGRIENIGQTR